MYYERTLAKTVKTVNRYFKVLLITGPRQVGKTTLLKALKEEGRAYVTLDDASDLLLAKEDPVYFLKKYAPPVIIDEIQKAPNLFPYIKKIVDCTEKRGLFWLTGSHVFHLMKNVSESLAGRVGLLDLQGFSQAEKRRDVSHPPFLPNLDFTKMRINLSSEDIFDFILQGSYPQLFDGTPRDLYFSSYVSTYIERDVRTILNVTNQLTFMKFLKVLAARTAQVLNYNDMARDVEVSAPTIKRWVSVLETSGLIYLLPAYSRNLSQRAIRTPKLYFMDTGLCCYLNGISSRQMVMECTISGALFETYVVSEVLKSYIHNGKTPSLYFYRDTDNNKEIDLILEEEGKVWPVEIKKTSSPTLNMTRHFSVIDTKVRGKGAVICTSEKFSALSKDVVVIPVGFV